MLNPTAPHADESIQILPTRGRALLSLAQKATQLARARLGRGLGLWRLVNVSSRVFTNWQECPVVGPDLKPMHVDVRGTGFAMLTQGYSVQHIIPLLEHLDDTSIVLDIGANIGVMARLLASRVPNGRVYAFEPSPSTFELLEKNCAQITSIECIQAAIGAETGIVAFDDHKAPALRHIVPSKSHDKASIAVPVSTLDDWVRAAGLQRLDFLKVDIEGFEEELLEGAQATLRTFAPVILFEYLPEFALARSRFQGRMLFRTLKKLCYEIYRLDARGFRHEDFVTPEDWTNDYVAVPPGARARFASSSACTESLPRNRRV
jgi:FkbM family methyltransferase